MPHGFIGLAVRIIFRIRLYEAGINGCGFGYSVHSEWNVTVLPFLLATHFLELLKLRLDILHNATQCPCLWQVDVLCLSVLNFRNLVTHSSCFTGKYGIGDTRPDANQFREIDIPCKTVVFFEFSACRELQHLLNVSEVPYKIIKIVYAVLFHCI